MKNTIGSDLSLTIFGESHGRAIGAVLDGMAAGLPVDEAFLAACMDKRRARGDGLSTPRVEADAVQLLSGVVNGRTTGTAIALMIENTNTRSGDYAKTADLLRPGHADYTAYAKYHGFQDARGGGHFSGRVTAALVAGGAIVLSALHRAGIDITTHIAECAGIADTRFAQDDAAQLSAQVEALASKPEGFAVLDETVEEPMKAAIRAAGAEGDSVGGMLETAILGLPAGIGEPYFDSVESEIAHLVFSVPAVKGIEFGTGFGFAGMRGSEANDAFRMTPEGAVVTATNHNAGINGGIANGMPVVFRTVVKPTPSIYKQQDTVDYLAKKDAQLSGYRYDLCPLPTEEEARAFLAKRQFKAINVTIPYKKLVMEYCSYIDPRAKAIGAVNTVVNKNGLLYGYNTDYMGFAHLCDAHGVSFAGKTVVILGTGGTHNTTSAVARDKGAAKVLTVSRHPDPEKGELSYAEAVSSGAQIVINTTPAGMYPNVGVCNLDVAAMPGLEAVVDVVYNPDKTELILRAEEAGVPVAVGGLEMLVAQAVYAAEYFLDRKFEDAPVEIRRITAALRRDMLNIALIGMPSSGKTTLGRMLAKSLGRTLVDLDEEIVKTDGRSIPDIFAAEGEDGFRTKETAETQRFGKEGRQLISCGGGIVKKPGNLRALHQNGIILFIDRPVDALAVGGGRPLSSSMDALRQMEAQRRPLYLAAADAVIPNNGTLDDALHAAMEALDEIFDS